MKLQGHQTRIEVLSGEMGAPEGYFAHFSIRCLPVISVNNIYCANTINDADTVSKPAIRQWVCVVRQGGSPQVGDQALAYADGQYSRSTTQVHVRTYHGHTQRAALASGSSSGWGRHENAPQTEHPSGRSQQLRKWPLACIYTFYRRTHMCRRSQ